MNNPVAKHCRTFNKATVQRDRTKFHRPSTNSLMDEYLEELYFAELEDETPPISSKKC